MNRSVPKARITLLTPAHFKLTHYRSSPSLHFLK
jgi:hypothetical protein